MLLAVGVLFFWMVGKAWSTREIRGRGWGFSSRMYSRDSEPVMYWVNFSSYLIIAVWTTVFAALAARKSLL
jgi:hypothetical protein